jgi:hypothetical protein
MNALKAKPRVLAVKEKKLEERAPPSRHEWRFVEVRAPKAREPKAKR